MSLVSPTVRSARNVKRSATVATVASAAAAVMVKAAAPTLSNAPAAEQAAAIVAAVKGAHVKVAAAALSESEGRPEQAAALVGPAVVPTLHLIARIIPILRNSAPAALFTDGNNRGARVGELFASRLGLSALYRDASRADLKAARSALIESAK